MRAVGCRKPVCLLSVDDRQFGFLSFSPRTPESFELPRGFVVRGGLHQNCRMSRNRVVRNTLRCLEDFTQGFGRSCDFDTNRLLRLGDSDSHMPRNKRGKPLLLMHVVRLRFFGWFHERLSVDWGLNWKN
ncbi:MAG: hypothetical protein RLZZ517_327 [Candidatus Parcubacteria bacterium]